MATISTVFDGSSDRIDLGHDAAFDFERTDAFSLSFWIKTSSVSGDRFPFSKLDGTNRGWDLAVYAAGGIQWGLFNDNGTNKAIVNTTSSKAVNDGIWHHVVTTSDGSSTAAGLLVYVDGVDVGASTISDGLTSTIQNVASAAIGARPTGGGSIIGNMVEVAIYDKELTPSEVVTIYNRRVLPDLTSVGPTGNLVGYWRLGDGDAYPTITDLSGSGNDGTMTSMGAGAFSGDVPAVSEASVNFDGLNDFATAGNVAEVNFDESDPFSYSWWFRTSDTFGSMVGKVEGSGNFRGWGSAIQSSGEVTFYLANVTSTSAISIRFGSGYNDDAWHHAVLTYDGSSTAAGVNAYIDGVPATPNVLTDNLSGTTLNTASFIVGASGTGSTNLYAGYVDNVAVYDKELSQSEALTLYGPPGPVDYTLVGPTANLVGYWNMGEGDLFPTLFDSSASGNDLTMTLMTAADIEPEVFPVLTHTLAPISPVFSQFGPGVDESAVFVQLFDVGDSTILDFTATYHMRARNVTNTAYIHWSSDVIDFTGGNAPETILGGTAVLVGVTGDQKIYQTAVPTASYIQSVDAPATATDPATGLGYVLVDTASVNWSASDVISLPASPQLDATITVKDSTGSADTKPIVVSGNGNTIDGSATEDILLSYEAKTFIYDGTEWKVV